MTTREVKFEMRRRAHVNDDPQALHQGFLAAMRTAGHPWWNSDAKFGELDLHGKLECQVDVSEGLPGDAIASLAYVHRGTDYLQDKALFDDRFVATLQVDDGRYAEFVNAGLGPLLDAFRPYRAQVVLDEDLALDDWDVAIARSGKTGKDEDGRDGMIRLWPVVFIDDELCRRSLAMSPDMVVNRLEGKVERLERLFGGILIVASSELLDLDGVVATDRRIRKLLA
jgi:hypothetical protein